MGRTTSAPKKLSSSLSAVCMIIQKVPTPIFPPDPRPYSFPLGRRPAVSLQVRPIPPQRGASVAAWRAAIQSRLRPIRPPVGRATHWWRLPGRTNSLGGCKCNHFYRKTNAFCDLRRTKALFAGKKRWYGSHGPLPPPMAVSRRSPAWRAPRCLCLSSGSRILCRSRMPCRSRGSSREGRRCP